MMATMIQLVRTAIMVRRLLARGMFAELRITRGIDGLTSRLFVEHHGVCSIMSIEAADGLIRAMRRIESRQAA